MEWLATGFGLGWIPMAPGTFGTLPGVALVLWLWPLSADRPVLRLLPAILLPVLAIPLCGAAERHFGVRDDRRIVADEYAVFPISMLGLPVTWQEWWVVPLVFVAARVFDVLKPAPAEQMQRLPGGWGIVLDDVVAALYTLVFAHGATWTLRSLL